jgi:hypothetical protein
VHKFGDTLYVKSTDEPNFVVRQFKRITLVRRPIMGQDGIRYRFGWAFNAELETLAEQTTRTLQQIKARNEIAQADMDAEGLAMPALAFKKPATN